jgi:hypothetical protein
MEAAQSSSKDAMHARILKWRMLPGSDRDRKILPMQDIVFQPRHWSYDSLNCMHGIRMQRWTLMILC